ncbi:hypothetical protein F2P81_015561 [Scophthalmus maximus]|uniref:Uncharacterized protein n=1 Tax=Scophthalmus maximus TaxID=52904 RepID=A0A6A4SQI4_SCOMX|nr:hypothetical protein F2P81_015561 [Scophthalmus maximus]
MPSKFIIPQVQTEPRQRKESTVGREGTGSLSPPHRIALPAKQNDKNNLTADSSAFTVNIFMSVLTNSELFVAVEISVKWVTIFNKSDHVRRHGMSNYTACDGGNPGLHCRHEFSCELCKRQRVECCCHCNFHEHAREKNVLNCYQGGNDDCEVNF